MDINYFLRRHQISLMRAAAAPCTPSRLAHEGLAARYAELLASYKPDSPFVTLAGASN